MELNSFVHSIKRNIGQPVVALFLWLSLFSFAYAENFALPELGSTARSTLSPQQEETLSLAFLEALFVHADLNHDPELNGYIRNVGQRLLRNVRTDRRFQFYLINDNSINAFAGPGGIIGINTGLLLAAKTEDELAAVIAHEIQHVQQEHISRMFDNNKKGLLPTLAGIAGALIVGSQSPQAGMAMMTGAIAYNAQQQLAFSRDHEWEADRFGIDTLAEAGYNPDAMASFFETLASRYRNDGKASEILMSHPVTDKRIADSKARAQTITRKLAKHQSINLSLAQARLEALQQHHSQQTNSINCYQQRVISWQRQESNQCQPLPTHLWSDIIELQTHRTINNEQKWGALLDIYPQDIALLLHRADELLEQKNYQAVIHLLEPQTNNQNETWALWLRIAKAWHLLNDNPTESWALSKGYGKIGLLKLSKIQLEKAQRERNSSNNPHINEWLEKQSNWLENQEKERKRLE